MVCKKENGSNTKYSVEKTTTLYPITNIEFMTLQIRKIIEHIAMGNLMQIKNYMSNTVLSFPANWNAKYIFKRFRKAKC